jgi:hypothetical protein
MIHRIIAFGCSNTYGQGLSDCISADGSNAGKVASKFAWPAIVGNSMSLPVVNAAYPGNSTYGIMHDIIHFSWQPGDIAVVLMTYFGRYTVYSDGTSPSNIQPGINQPAHLHNTDCFYDLLGEQHLLKMEAEAIDHIFYFLNYNAIQYHIRFADACRHREYIKYTKVTNPVWQDKICDAYWDSCIIDIGCDAGSGSPHQGPKSHAMFAATVVASILD